MANENDCRGPRRLYQSHSFTASSATKAQARSTFFEDELIDDVYEPLSLYSDSFKDEYAKNTATFFEALV